MINTLFIGFQYVNGNLKEGESIDSKIFVKSMSKIENVEADFFSIDNLTDVESDIKKHVDRKKYDLIFFNLIKNELPISLLNFLKENHVTLNWFGDDQWRFHNFSLKYAPHFTYIITTDKFKLHEYRSLGYENVVLSQWAAFSLISIPKQINYLYDISFIGSYSISREYVIEYLKKEGFRVSVFGKGWNSSVSCDEMNQIMLKSKINLNLSNSIPTSFDYLSFLFEVFKKFLRSFLTLRFKVSFKNLKKLLRGIKIFTYNKKDEQIKARNFEIPSNYGFQISKYAIGLEDYYDIGKEIIVFNSLKELKLLCKHYLSNEIERKNILDKSYIKTGNHTYTKRLKHIINDIN